MDTWPYAKLSGYRNDEDENCYAVGQVEFTAGVTRSQEAKYISPRVVEDQTPLDKVKFEPSPWVREAVWWLSDLMPMIALMNTSQLPTFNNLDIYAENLVRQAYLGAWDMLHHRFDDKATFLSAYPAEARLVADVSRTRVFVWMALCLLVTVLGVLLLARVLREEDLKMPEELVWEGREERRDELSGAIPGAFIG